jgi:hypothetical protein
MKIWLVSNWPFLNNLVISSIVRFLPEAIGVVMKVYYEYSDKGDHASESREKKILG